MSDEQQPSTEQAASTETQAQSLDDVYKTFNVETEAQSFQPQRDQRQAAPVQQNPASVPDPVLDPNGYKSWASQQHEFTKQALSKLHGELTQFKVERLRAREEADIKTAVQTFKQVAGEDVDEDIAEVALGQKARKDPRFLAVYQNREKNPAAWTAAVKAYANEFKGKHSFKVDPQLAENQRAAKQSTQGSQTKQKDEPTGAEAQFHGKAGREFDNTWRRYVDSSY
jgi:hypothetical protein